jgi:hypothetical protein
VSFTLCFLPLFFWSLLSSRRLPGSPSTFHSIQLFLGKKP